ncbi:hypothetical protein HanIR_Chr10g0480281 [Helianthus annuus]|nr:hypothetical protein HanIR_Chr10g0480281 [Helianthus annuus]
MAWTPPHTPLSLSSLHRSDIWSPIKIETERQREVGGGVPARQTLLPLTLTAPLRIPLRRLAQSAPLLL